MTVGPQLRTISGEHVKPVTYQFQVGELRRSARTLTELDLQRPSKVQTLDEQPRYRTAPADLPSIRVTKSAEDTADGYVFASTFSFPGLLSDPPRPYLLIMDNQGEIVYYQPLTKGYFGADFKRQPNGLLSYFDTAREEFVLIDEAYNEVETYTAGNGYPTDVHELQILPDGHALLMIYDVQQIDMRRYTPEGKPDSMVIGLIVQELDQNRNVVFEWRSWDHIPITDTVYPLTEPELDYIHGNAIEQDSDGNLLISSRHTNEITKIDRQTGNVIWRWGGKANQFTFVNDEPFVHQHDIRRLPNGNVSLFDNRTDLTPVYSRAVEYQLDEANKTATKVREFRHTPDIYSFAMGNAQHLSNGNMLVGWGSAVTGAITEFRPDGSMAFDLVFDGAQVSYRAFRFPWQGRPSAGPALLATGDRKTTTLFTSRNGATNVATYRVYGGADTHNMVLLGTETSNSFETQITLTDLPTATCFFRVVALNGSGRALRSSQPIVRDSADCHQRRQHLPLLLGAAH